MHWLITYGVVLVVLTALDLLWITFVTRRQYDFEVSDVLREKTQWPAGVLFYLVYAAGVSAFAVLPMTRHFNGIHAVPATYRDVAAWGAGLGLFAYATFALTNQAVIKDWRYKLVLNDVAWGAVLSAIVTLAGFATFRLLA